MNLGTPAEIYNHVMANLKAEVARWRDAERRAKKLPNGLVSIGAFTAWPPDKCRAAARQALNHAKAIRNNAPEELR